jgi:lysophospholipase L1-like esterase
MDRPRALLRLSLGALVLVVVGSCGSKSPGPIGPTTQAPQITCPVDLSVGGISGSSQATTYTAPVVSGGAAPVATTCSPSSGASFPLGTTTVNCTAIDAVPRQAACSFKVTLTGLAIAAKKYETMGDSFTEGENGRPPIVSFLDIPNAYPTKLQQNFDLTFPGQGIAVINRGHSGDPVEETVKIIRTALPGDKPDAVLLLTGFNNLFNGGCRIADGQNPGCATAIDNVVGGVRECIRKIKENPTKVSYIFVSTLTPPGPLVPPTSDRRIRADVIVQVNAKIKQVAAAEGANVVDPYPLFLGHEAEYVDNDGLHPRPAGKQVLADTFFAAIRAIVPQTPLLAINGPR